MAQAQAPSTLNIHLDPIIPGPNRAVSVRAESFAVDLARSTLSWSINGKLLKRDVGLTTFEFTTGPVGTATALDVRVATPDGITLEKSVVLRPVTVDLLVDADTSTPPFYKGRALPVMQSTVRVVALPNFSTPSAGSVPASDIVFTWKRDFKTIPEQSGRGRDVLTMGGDHLFNSKGISVTAISAGKSLTAQGSAGIVVQDPKIVLYRNDPLLGIRYDRALSGAYRFSEAELSIRPEFFFFSLDTDAILETAWNMNGRPFVTPPGRFATFRNNNGREGSASLSVQVLHTKKLLQTAATNINLSWEGSANGAFSAPKATE